MDPKAAESTASFVPDSTRIMNLDEMVEKVRFLASNRTFLPLILVLVRYFCHYSPQHDS